MTFTLSGFASPPYLQLPGSVWAILLAALLSLLTVGLLLVSYRDFRRLRVSQWVLLAALSVLAPILSQVLTISLKGVELLPPPYRPEITSSPVLALFGTVSWVLAGGMLGLGPGVLVGFAAGLGRGLWETHSALTPLQTALLAGAASYCMQQDYRGKLAALLRRPFLASLAGGAAIFPIAVAALWVESPAVGLARWDYVYSLLRLAYPMLVLEAGLGGLEAEFVRAGFLSLWPRKVGLRPAPFVRSLNHRILFYLVPMGVIGLLVLFALDTGIAVRVATGLVVDQMGRSAANASQGIPFFIQTGRSLVGDLARNLAREQAAPADLSARLEHDLRAVPYFRQLIYFNTELQPLAGYPEGDPTRFDLSEAESQAIARGLQGVPQDLVVLPERPGGPALLSFSAAATVPDGPVVGVLMGRADLETNPLTQPVLTSLQGVVVGEGFGFLVDKQGQIIYHPDRQQVGLPFEPNLDAPSLPVDVEGARAYQDVAPDGTRRIVYYLPVTGHPWSVVVQTPFTLALALATRISFPVILILAAAGGLALGIISYLARRLTLPIGNLAKAVEELTDTELATAVPITGEDEVGRLGQSFEQMRRRLRARLDELGLLLEVSQGVASSLSLERSVPPILQGALSGTGAAGARLVLPAWSEGPGEASSEGPPRAFAEGTGAAAMAPLDEEVLSLTRDEGRAVIQSLSRARAVLNVAKVAGKVQALIALPLRQESAFVGALWVGYPSPRSFGNAEINFLTTLAGQAAVAVANARLFQTAERGRERLQAILTSTPDGVLVTDRVGRLIQINPAAEHVLGLERAAALRRPVAEVIRNPSLLAAIRASDDRPTAKEVALENGQTLFASSSPIIGPDGRLEGRVCVLGDITRYKELDALKTEFVRTLTHDLINPLMSLSGVARMLPVHGDLNAKQREYVDRILEITDHMNQLIDDLLGLDRIEAGGLKLERLDVGDIIQSVASSHRQTAIHKGLSLQVELAEGLPAVAGDATLLRQALSNLVENAIKFTPKGGSVRVRGGVENLKLVLSVQDTGLGIAPADQAHLFEKFYRVRQREAAQVRGTGLGLAIVQAIAKRHGGEVWVNSRLGQGSTFFLALPVNGQARPNS